MNQQQIEQLGQDIFKISLTDYRPTIIAICGKSASGKDTLAQQLLPLFSSNFLINYTSRPIREGEQNNHLDGKDFISCLNAGIFLDSVEFRGWYYGHSKKDVIAEKINIGIFDNEELKKMLFSWGLLYQIVPIYIDVNWKERLRRSIKREHKFRFEYLRRMWAEYKQYKHFFELFDNFPNSFIIRENGVVIMRGKNL